MEWTVAEPQKWSTRTVFPGVKRNKRESKKRELIEREREKGRS